LLIAATGYFYTSNRHTLTAFLGEPLELPEAITHWEGFVIEIVLRAVRADDAQETTTPPHEVNMTPIAHVRSRRPKGVQAPLGVARREA
jgi:hypothetical protein